MQILVVDDSKAMRSIVMRPDLPAGEMADAFCEIVDIVAGGFKARISDRAGSLQLGLPAFLRGPAQPTGHTAVEVAVVRLGPVSAARLLACCTL